MTVPFILSDRHRDWATESVQSFRSSCDGETIAIVNAHRADRGDLEWLKNTFTTYEINDKNNLARAWNKGIEKAISRGADYIVIANLDIIFHVKCIDRLLALAKRHKDNLIWSATAWHDQLTLNHAELRDAEEQHVHWSCFLVDKNFITKMGPFDEQFDPAYLEDSDMRHRLRLAGIREINATDALFYHMDRASIKGVIEGDLDSIRKNLSFFNSLSDNIAENGKKYMAKWNGGPYQEKYKTPYGK